MSSIKVPLLPRQDARLGSFSLGTCSIQFNDDADPQSKQIKYFNHFEAYPRLTDLVISFHHGRKSLQIVFWLHNQRYQLTTKYSSIQTIIKTDNNNQIYIRLRHPMLLYLDQETKKSAWLRTSSIPDTEPFNIGKCNVLRLTFKQQHFGDRLNNYYSLSAIVSTFKLFVADTVKFENWNLQEKDVTEASGFNRITISDRKLYNIDNFERVPFELHYAALSVMNISYQFEDEIIDIYGSMRPWTESIAKCDYSTDRAVKILEQSFFDLFRVLDSGSLIYGYGYFIERAEKLKKSYEKEQPIDDTILMRRAVLTPTRLLLLLPHPFIESRFIRTGNPEYALRLLIRDDDDNQLNFSSCMTGTTLGQRNFLYDVIKNPILNGIEIAQNIYHFLGCSTSQLRDHGMILYAKDDQCHTAEHHRNKIGDLSNIRAVPKYLARLGLAFSQPMCYMDIDNSCQFILEDIERGIHPHSGDPYTFTDGVGQISISLATKLCHKLGIDLAEKSVPSAYQIRYKGAKGLVVIKPSLYGERLGLRRSMIKFEKSTSCSLEVLKYSKKRQVYLNRPLISLLDQLGTKRETIMKMQIRTLQSLINAFHDNTEAIFVLKCFSQLMPSIVPLARLLDGKVNVVNEPFFTQTLESVCKRAIIDLKEKARIPVDIDKGRIMFGCVDDYDLLEYEEVFVQVSHEGRANQVLEGEILVTKYPCMHPGDVRKFKAVIKADLMHLVDVIVFPAKGDRPHPDEMAGSDLDGDEYSVIWDTELYFEGVNRKPMNFPCLKADVLYRPINTEDMINFFVKFLQGNIIGIIANAHLALSDSTRFDTPSCIELCHLYAKALDFAKTGHSASLATKDRPVIMPDFMMKGAEKPTYQSKRTLGHLYRQILEFEVTLTIDEYEPKAQPMSSFKKFQFDGYEEYLTLAKQHFDFYVKDIEILLKRLNLKNERDLFGSSVVSSSSHFAGRRENEDGNMLVDHSLKKLRNKHRKFFLDNASSEIHLEAASAYYYISLQNNNQRIRNGKAPIYSFAWVIVPNHLSIISKRNSSRQREVYNHINYAIEQLNDAMKGLPLSSKNPKQILKHWARNQFRLLRNFTQSEENELVSSIEKDVEKVEMELKLKNADNPGSVIVHTLEYLKNALFEPSSSQTKNVCYLKLALAAANTLIKYYRAFKPEYILKLLNSPSNNDNEVHLLVKTFFLGLFIDSFVGIVKRDKTIIEKYLLEKTNVAQVSATIVSDRYDNSAQYLLVCAQGTRNCLHELELLVQKRDFYSSFKDTVKHSV